MEKPYFTPSPKQLADMESALGKHLIGNDLQLRRIVLEMLQYSEGESQWENSLPRTLPLPPHDQCAQYERKLSGTLWVSTDPSISQVLIHFTKPICLESHGSKRDAGAVIYDSETPLQPTLVESDEWAFVVNQYMVKAVTVAMPSIEQYGVDTVATDVGCLEFLSEQLFLKNIAEDFCPTPVSRGDDGATSIWIELTRRR